MKPDNCPHCGTSLRGNPIPEHQQEMFGGATHFGRKIGVEVMGVYDGVLYYVCPDCKGAWNRWPEDHYLHGLAEREMFNADMRNGTVLGIPVKRKP